MVELKIERLAHAEGIDLPFYASPGAAGADLQAAIVDDVVLQPGTRAIVPTGFAMEIPLGYEVQIRPRSGLAAKYGVTVLNAPGTIDSDYRGEVKIILINHGEEPFVVSRGSRIAQMVLAPVVTAQISEAVLSDTSRGDKGFGSTGMGQPN